MLTRQQREAKGRAHELFDLDSNNTAAAYNIQPRTKALLPRFARGIAGIGIGRAALRIYLYDNTPTPVEIPSEIAGLPTEKIPTSGFTAHAQPPRQTLNIPLLAGISIGHRSGATGTLGCFVDTPAHGRCILGNAHILAGSPNPALGDPILQPGPADSAPGANPNHVARLSDYEPLHCGGHPNVIDAAVADPSTLRPCIMALGPCRNPPVPAAEDQPVAKHGRSTGLTFGTVVDASADVDVYYNGHPAYFANQILLQGDDTRFSEPGDSGSIVLTTPSANPVALLFAADDSQSIANPIKSVLNRFGATIVSA